MLQLIAVCTSAIVLLWAAVELLDRPHLCVPLIVASSVAASLDADLRVTLGSISVTATDVLVLLLATSIGIGLAVGRLRADRPTWPWLGLLALLAVGLVRGVAAFGPERATNAARLLALFLVTVTFVALQRRHQRQLADWITGSVLVGAAVLAVAAGLFLARNGFGTYVVDGRRSLDSLGALLVAQAGLLAAGRRTWPTGARWAVGVLSLIVLVSTQQRTVAVAVAAGVLVLILSSGRGSRTQTLAGLGLGLVVLLVAVGSISGLSQSLRTATDEPFQRGSTINWRVQGWVELVDTQLEGSAADLAVGDPAGTGTARRIRVDGQLREVVVSAHSQWVSTLLATGVVGLVAWTAAIAWTVWRNARNLRPELAGFYAAGAAALVFSITYQLSADQGLIVGLLVAAATLGSSWPGGPEEPVVGPPTGHELSDVT